MRISLRIHLHRSEHYLLHRPDQPVRDLSKASGNARSDEDVPHVRAERANFS